MQYKVQLPVPGTLLALERGPPLMNYNEAPLLELESANTGVTPLLATRFTSAPFSNRRANASVCPDCEAMNANVRPMLPAWFTSASCGKRMASTPVCHSCDAMNTGVNP